MEGDWIEYYCRDKLFTKVINVAQRSGVDFKWKFYQGLGLVLGGKASEGITCLKPILPHSDFGLAAAHLSIKAHRSCGILDKEALTQLEWQIEDTSVGNNKALYYAATTLLHADDVVKARSYLDQLFRLDSTSVDTMVLNGWIELRNNNKKAAAHAFKTALSLDKSNIDAILGEVSTLEPAEGISRLNQLIVRYPKLAAPLVEKMRLQLSIRDWHQTLETATRVLSLESNNLAALELRALHFIAVEGNYDDGVVSIRRFGEELELQGTENDLILAAQLFSRTCGYHVSLLAETTKLAEKAVQKNPGSVQALLELATQLRVSRKLSEASRIYRQVTKLDPNGTDALTGLTATQLAQAGPTDQVLQQVEFLMEVVGSNPSPELLLLKAQCEHDRSASMEIIDHAVSLSYAAIVALSYGPGYLRTLNPNLLVKLTSQYPETVEGLTKQLNVLRQVADVCPGLTVAVLSLAQAYTALGDYNAAIKTAKSILTHIDATNTDAHLILAQIHLAKEEYEEANSCLELALSYNLQVRERPLYNVLLGAIKRYYGDNPACIETMRTALSQNKEEGVLSTSELATLYLELVAALTAAGQTNDASLVLAEAQSKLKGSKEEGKLMVACAELAVVKEDYSSALTILGSIKSDHPSYLQARKKMAYIHLHKLKDGHAFVECFQELVNQKPLAENFILLGDAYMAIQEPELAVDSYEKAMKSSSSDPKLSVRLGRVLVHTHQYGKAIKCFRDAGSEGSMELANLLIRLGQLDAAESALLPLPLTQKAFLLAKVHEKSGELDKAMQVIKKAREEIGASEVELNAKMCAQLAEYSSAARDYDSAISYYKRALQYKPGNTHVEIALANLYMQVNDWSACQSVCSSLLARDPDNEPALLMLADLAYRRVDFHDAAAHFSTLLSRRPDHWVALARLIEVKRRTGQLHSAKVYLQAAMNVASGKLGLSYCTGLYEWYSGNVNSALHHFNSARVDSEWGQQALHNMVELCLAGEGDDGVATATRLLAQMKPHSADEEYNVRLLQNFILLSSKEKQDIELAMADLTQLAGQETLRVGATLGLATGFIAQKQVARARNVLKRVAKAAWTVEEAEYLERCWLLLADLHAQAGKHDAAVELLRRVLSHNLSCYRAYELLGLVAEKEQKYLEASLQYKQAWKLNGENNPVLGFKLAFNLVKGKRYADAIITCNAVLMLNPDYPRIRKEILEKAINHLRT